ncbi:MAG: radical SAM family heme chaperone HemW [Acidimicrobiales bacterium]
MRYQLLRPSLPRGSSFGGVYVHVPFCEQACSYCAFSVVVGKEALIPDYLRALRAEWVALRETLSWTPSTLFIGGGTPSQIGSEGLSELLEIFSDENFEEITVEVNPESLSKQLVSALRAASVTRVSVGVQSFDAEVLRSFRRAHDPETARDALLCLREGGLENVSIDLIFGAVCESDASWERTLMMAMDPEFAIQHVSCYALTVEKRTRLHASVADHPHEDVLARRYRFADDLLADYGFLDYEISNWARQGYYSRHNVNYWRRRPYVGVGVAAHSFDGTRRWWNESSFNRYLRAIDEGRSPVVGSELLSATEIRSEEIMLGLRCSDGIPCDWVVIPDELQFFVEIREGRYHLKAEAKILADSVLAALLEKLDDDFKARSS